MLYPTMAARIRIGAFTACLAVSQLASAQEIQLSGPLEGACVAILKRDATPAILEGTHYLSVAYDAQHPDGTQRLQVGTGAELTLPAVNFGPRYHYGGPFEFRLGPWGHVGSRLPGSFVEGGIVTTFGQQSHAQWGTFGLRAGVGYGDLIADDTSHLTITLTGGIHQFTERYSSRGVCDPVPEPATFAYGSILRLFATGRRALDDRGDGWQLTFGLELSPTFFLPPHAGPKWIGAPPP